MSGTGHSCRRSIRSKVARLLWSMKAKNCVSLTLSRRVWEPWKVRSNVVWYIWWLAQYCLLCENSLNGIREAKELRTMWYKCLTLSFWFRKHQFQRYTYPNKRIANCMTQLQTKQPEEKSGHPPPIKFPLYVSPG